VRLPSFRGSNDEVQMRIVGTSKRTRCRRATVRSWLVLFTFARIASAEPARAPAVFYGVGLSHASSVGAVCDARGERCAVADLDGRIAIVDRATGGVLATSVFHRDEAIAFDASGDHLGVGLAEWDWRTNDVRFVAERSCCVALAPNRIAWVDGAQFGAPARIHIRNRGGAPAFEAELSSAGIKYLEFAGDDWLFIVHTDSVEAFDLSGASTQRTSLQLAPERGGDSWRPYHRNPRLQLTRTHVLLRSLPGELRVLTRKLELVRTVELNGSGGVFANPDSDLLVRTAGLANGHTAVEVEDAVSGKHIASTELEGSSSFTVHFWKDRLVLSQFGGVWLWDLRSPPAKVPATNDVNQALALAGSDLLAMHARMLRITPLDASRPPRAVSEFSVQVLPSGIALAGDHLLVRAGAQVEAWGADGVQPATPDELRLVLGPTAELDASAIEGVVSLRGAGNRLVAVSVPKDDWVTGVAFDSKRTRAVVTLRSTWRLYDLARGTVLRSGKVAPDWPRTVASFSPRGEAFLVVDPELVTSYSRDGKQLARVKYPREEQLGSRGGSGDQPAANIVWTAKGVVLSLWSEPEVWFLKSPSLQFIARVPGGYANGLTRLATGVAVLDRGALYSDEGVLRATLPTSRVSTVSADGSLVAYCAQSAVVVVDELGKTVDGDASFCDDARALSVSRSHLAVVRRGEVRLLRRDDRSLWTARSFRDDRARGFGRNSNEPPPPPSRLFLLEHEDRYGLSDSLAGPFVTNFGMREVPLTELTSSLWR
jgi:hypothetical protein